MTEYVRTRDEEFWYSDGNIVLIAGSVEFRVYKGVLASHSPVFKDVFSLPQPQAALPSTPPSDEPCPVVHLPDSPGDLRHVLRVYMPKGDSMYVFRPALPSGSTDNYRKSRVPYYRSLLLVPRNRTRGQAWAQILNVGFTR